MDISGIKKESILKVDNRFMLVLVMLLIFSGWLAMVAFWLVPMISGGGEQLDPMMSLIAGLGIGGVTNSFIVLITLSWQFYFRKREESGSTVS